MDFTTMRVYFWREGKEVVAQNWVSCCCGQTHRHTLKEWEKWKIKREKKGGFEFIDQDRQDEEVK